MVEEGRTWGQESESEQLAFFRFCSIVLLRVFVCNSGLVANKLLSASLMSGRCHLHVPRTRNSELLGENLGKSSFENNWN